MEKMLKVKKKEKQKEKQNKKLLICDYCRMQKLSWQLDWEEDQGEWLCKDCKAEKESCGCSD